MYHLLQEGIVDDVTSVGKLIVAARDGFNSAYTDTMNDGTNKNSLKTYSYSSAARAASNLICVFPVLASRTVSAESAQMISKYIEQKGCIILQMALQAANISNAKNGMDYIRNFHQNLNIGGDGLDALTKTLNSWIDGMDDSALNTARENDSRRAGSYHESSIVMSMYNQRKEVDDSAVYEWNDEFTLSPMQMKSLMEEFADAEKYQIYDTKLNPISINDYIVDEAAGNYHVSIGVLNEGGKGREWQKQTNKNLNTYERLRKVRDEKEKRAAEEQEKLNKEAEKKANQRSKVTSTRFELMKDQDIKKMNNAVPSLLIVRFYSDSKATVSTEFIIGVRAKVVGVNSDEILRRIANDNKDGKFMTNLLRTMTGELKKSDFLFGISRTSEDLQAIKKKGSQGDTWALLQSRALAAKQAVRQGRINDFSAITTVLVSQADCDELYKEENIDMTNPNVARHFMSSYNLLGFVIADDATQSIKMIFDDGDNYFEEVSYTMLERETDNRELKKMINLIANSR